MLGMLLVLLIAANWLYWLVAWYSVHAFFQSRMESNSGFRPSVSILKPLKGLDAQAYENFVSFCRQDYPDFELLFGVADPQDPIIPVVTRLQHDFPEQCIRLITAPVTTANQKVGILHHLATHAHHEILVINDSDMQVTPDYLQQVVAPLANEHIGLVTCLYHGGNPATFTARLESLHMGATFLPAVVVARYVLGMCFALGATVVLRRSDLARLGGFVAFGDYLADDYQLGARIASLGKQVHLSKYIVTSVLGATTFREQWQREVRWARTYRVCRPLEYPGLLVIFGGTPLALALVLVTGFAPEGLLVLGLSLLLRWLMAWRVASTTGDQAVRRWLIWLPVRDLLSTLVWCVGAWGRRIVWRDEEFRMQPDGRLQPLPPCLDAYPETENIDVPEER